MAKSGILSRVGIAIPPGSIYNVTGLREFDPDWSSVHRSTKVSVWRQESDKADFGDTFSGRLDMEVTPGTALAILFGNILTRKAVSNVDGFDSQSFRLVRSAPPHNASFDLHAAFDGGPWQTYSDVVLKALRLTVRGQSIAHVSADWTSPAMVESQTDPGWTFEEVPAAPITGSKSTVTVNEESVEGIEFTLAITLPRAYSRMNRSGVAGRATGQGPTIVSGNLVQYFGTPNLPALVRGQTEFSIGATIGDGARLEVNLPRVMPASGQARPTGDEDVTASIAFRALSDADLDEDSEIEVSVITPAVGSS